MEYEEKHIRENARAAAVIARDRKHKEQRKNALPPFLMVRAGLLDAWIVPIATTILVARVMGTGQNFQANFSLVDIACGALVFGTICYGAISTDKKRKLLKQDIETIKNEFSMYLNHKDYPLDLVGTIYSPRLAKILMKHIVKHEPGIFDKMIENPNSVLDTETQSHIIAGYLSNHPGSADKIIQTFAPGEIDPKVYAKAVKYSNRLKSSGHNR